MTQVLTLRMVTRQAGGGEIVRMRRLEGVEALIGRAPICEIHLPDLAVDMQHALLRVTGKNRVNLESLTGQPFLVDGKPALRVELEALRGHVVSFGDYNLIVAAGGEGDIAVTVMRREPDEAPSPALFSLRTPMFNRRRMAWTFALAILTLCLIVPLAGNAVLQHLKIHPDRQWSSGPLSKAHAFLEQDCQACHAKAFVAVRDQTCLSCHQANRPAAVQAASDARVERKGSPFLPLLVADHAPPARLRAALPPGATPFTMVAGAFQMALDHPADRCASCHREACPLTPDPAVARSADILRPGKPSLVVITDCAACHSRLKMRLPSTGLVDTPDWNGHPEFRPLVTTGFDGPQARVQRVSLAGRPVEANGLTFSHRIHMNPMGGVARQAVELGASRSYGAILTCQSCHRPDGGGFKPIEQERDCGACHSLAFAQVGGQLKSLSHRDLRDVPGVLRGVSPRADAPRVDPAVLRRGMARGGLCVDCHTIRASAGPLGHEIAPVRAAADRMLPWGDFNHGVAAHAGQGKGAAQCADCHKATTSDTAHDVLLEGIATCRACHGRTEHETARFAAANCGECHSFHNPGKAPPTGQERLFTALGLPAGQKPRGLPTF